MGLLQNRIWIISAMTAALGMSQLATASEGSPEEIEASLKAQGITLGSPTQVELQAPGIGVPPSTSAYPLVEIEVFKHSSNSGINKEFVLVSKDGAIIKAYVASAATEGLAPNAKTKELEHKNTPEFQNIKLSIPHVNGIPYPWTTSSSYGNSSMYWGLQINGGYFIHSTPHYSMLGTPASMGCVRVDFPTAMDLWDLVVNEVKGNAYISIYGTNYGAKGRASLAKRLHDSGLQMKDIQAMVDSDLADARAVTKKDYNGRGHKRLNESSVRWPLCGDNQDCFEAFRVAQPN